MSEQVWWYATRAAGLMTWTTATASVVVGLMLSARAIRARTGPWFLDLHRFLGGITVVFLIAHIATLWADSYVDFGPRELFVPGASEWRSEAIAWGIVAAYIMIAVEVSSLVRPRIGVKVWRVIHVLSFAAMAAGSYHAWLAGSDVKNPVTWAIAGTGSILVLGLVSLRLQRKDPDDPGPTGMSDNRSILEEMRRRLEELPIPESTPQPQLSVSPNATLPRRAPLSDALPGIASSPAGAPSGGPVGFSDDPFAAVPLSSSEPELGDWAAPSPADPFGVAPPPEPTRFRARPFTDRDAWADDGADLFENLTGDPFEALGANLSPDSDGFPELPPLEEKRDLFASAADSDPSVGFATNPFDPARPAASVIEAAAPPATPALTGPPPLPDAIDPVTGEPDEAAYTQWLKEWLSYAERYGDEAPGDPSRH
ncbi:MAG: ferric reductase-like transmembrane domain-containing protein [Acidimicrobiales bacterium]